MQMYVFKWQSIEFQDSLKGTCTCTYKQMYAAQMTYVFSLASLRGEEAIPVIIGGEL